jgi:hypothetical protein
MNKQTRFGLARFVFVVPMAIGLMAGCSKQNEETPPPATTGEQSQPQAGTPQAPARANRTAELSITEAQQALKNKEYDRALDALLAPPQAGKAPTPEQAAQLNAAMAQLQAQLATAAAAGDAKAIAARERLRQRSLQMP